MKNSETFKLVSAFLAGVIVPVFVVWLSGHLDNSMREKEIKAKYIELAIDILREKPNEDTANVRRWAIEVLSEYSPIPFPEKANKELQKESIGTTALSHSTVNDVYSGD